MKYVVVFLLAQVAFAQVELPEPQPEVKKIEILLAQDPKALDSANVDTCGPVCAPPRLLSCHTDANCQRICSCVMPF